MTKKELIKLLESYPDEIEVKITWEGLIVEIEPENIYLSKNPVVLLIDADENSYKGKYQSGEFEAL